mmetsp:Transcript_90926/g.177994  ORF Transcript_90926/g.177994 Transcript_90926/m.177994 type:complete len:3046 (+) Transcript_90926:19-9156(+)
MSAENEEGDSSVGGLRNLSNLFNPSLRVRQSLLGQVQSFLESDECNECKPGPLKRLFRSIASSFFDEQYDEQAWTNSLLNVFRVSASLAIPFDVAELVLTHIQEQQSTNHKIISPLSAARTIQLCTSLLSFFVTDGSADKDWVNGMLAVIGEHSDRIWLLNVESINKADNSTAQNRAQGKVVHYVGDMLRARPTLLGHCISVWFPTAAPTKCASSLCGVILSYTEKRQPAQYHNAKTIIAEVFQKRLQAVTKPQSQALASPAWMPLLHTITPADWTGAEGSADASPASASRSLEGYESLLVKLMKKAPESGSFVARSIVANVPANIDVSAFVIQVAAVSVVKMLKSSDASVRASGISLVGCLASKSQDIAAHQQLVLQLLEGYMGKGTVGAGGLMSSQAVQKRCVLRALSLCAKNVGKTLGNSAAGSVAMAVVVPMQTILEKEVDLSIRQQAAFTMGAWLKSALHTSASLSADDSVRLNALLSVAKTHMDKPVGASNPLGTCYLFAVTVATNDGSLETDANLEVLEPILSGACLTILKNAIKKPASGVAVPPTLEAALALHMALRFSRISSAVQNAFDECGLWSIINTHASLMYSPALVKLLTTSPSSFNCSGVSGSGVPSNAVVTELAVADGTVDNLGTSLLYYEVVRSIACSLEIVAVENAAKLSIILSPEANSVASLEHEPGQASRALIAYALHTADKTVRDAVCGHLNRVVTILGGASASIVLLQAIWSHLTTLSAQHQKYNQEKLSNFRLLDEAADSSAAGAAAKAVKAPVVPSPSRWQAVLLACVFGADSSGNAPALRAAVRSSAIVPYLITISAHPFVSTSSKKAAQVWQSVCAKILALFGLSRTINVEEEEEGTAAAEALSATMAALALTDEEISSSDIIPVLVRLLTEGGVCGNQNTRTAAQGAIYLLSDPCQILYADKRSVDCVLPQLDGSILTEYVLPALLPLLDLSAVSALTESDLLAYSSPSTAIATIIGQMQQQSEAARAAESVVTNADRKKTAPRSARRGNFGADSAVVDDQDWAERVRAEKAVAEQKARSEGGAEYEEVKQRVLAQHVDVAAKIDKVKYAIDLWKGLSVVNLSVARVGMTMLLSSGKLSELLRSAVVGENAHEFLVKMVTCTVESECAPHARIIADSLRIIERAVPSYTLSSGFASDEEALEAYREVYQQSGPVLSILQALLVLLSRSAAEHRGGAKHFPVSPCTFLLLYPVLRGVLLLPHVMPGTEHTFHLLDSLWPSVEVFCAKPMSSLYVPGIASVRCVQKSVLDVCLRVLGKPHRVDPPADRVFFRVCTQLPNSTAWPSLLPEEWEPLMGELGLLSAEMKVRLTVIQAVLMLFRERLVLVLNINPELECLLWLLKFDESEVVSAVAGELWLGRESHLTADFYTHLKPLLNHPAPHVRSCAARALAGALGIPGVNNGVLTDTLKSLQDTFIACLPPKREVSRSALPVAGTGKGGKGAASALAILSAPTESRRAAADDKHVSLRVSIANVFASVGAQDSIPHDVAVGSSVITSLVEFVLQCGMIDPNAEVRAAMLTAGRALIDSFGKELCAPLMSLLETVIAAKYSGDKKDEEALSAFDNRNGAAVVLLGATGRHLQKHDPAVGLITKNLIDALKTPSESVQRAVADCLTPLVQSLKGQEIAVTLLESLVKMTLDGQNYGERKGAAFGLSAFVKGLGIPCLKQHDIIPRLKEACANGSINNRQGALFAFECLSERIGLLFEPYIISIVEVLLKSFSHSSDHVREAAQDAARVIMDKLSAHGVKQVLTPILSSLPNEAAWKSRQESIRLLGMMAHCAPKQLASCLPQVVPALMLAGSDPHPKVKESAKAALTDISSVIRNPEVLRLSPVLLGAIGDPANKTREALEALLECEFMHSIDAPSLALLVPILARALRDRGADLKRKSAAITGNMVSMVSDAKILAPYLVQVLPGLQDCLLDPIPDVRATSAKAMGSLFVGMGEDQEELKRLIPWLSTTLSIETSPVERSGAAQGLAEICGSALGPERVQQVLQTVLRLQQQSVCGREGLLWFLTFLPATLNEGYAAYISITLPVILSGLSDENDGVRDVAMRAGQVVVYKLGISHTNELIPALTDGMFQEDYRIRLSSVQLLGELLCMVGETKAGTSGEADDDDDDGMFEASGGSLSKVSQKIRQHIGDAESNAVLASLYIVRSDVSMVVRQAALNVWKSIVSNSPRTLMEIMSVLVLQLIERLASPSEMLRSVAGTSLGDIVSKLGDKVLPAVVKPLREGLRSPIVSQRQGVCSGLNEIMVAATRKQAEDYLDVLVPALQQALCDPVKEVRSEAARAFLTLFKTVGAKAIHQIVPTLLQTYGSGDSADSEMALLGLREIVQQRPRDLLEYLLPTLMVSPVTVTSARALGAIISVAGAQLHNYFSSLVPALVQELASTDAKVEQLKATAAAGASSEQLDAECVRYEALKDAAGAVMSAVTTDGVHHLVGELGKQMEHDSNAQKRRWGCWLAGQFFSKSSASFSEYVPVLLKFLLSRVAESDRALLQAVSDALLALSAAVPPTDFADHMEFMRTCIGSTASAARHRVGPSQLLPNAAGQLILPLFTLPKSLDALYSILLHALMNGSHTAREIAADTIGELAQFADVAVLKPLLIKTTGPLIRVVGDRFPSSVKGAILQTLIVLLDKGGASLKAFVPQLQTTFVKALNDPAREVRTRGAAALGRLMPLSLRVDPLLTELTQLCLKAESTAIRISVLDAMGTVLLAGGNKATAPALEACKAALLQALSDEDDGIRSSASFSLARLTWFLEPSAVTDTVLDLLDSAKGSAVEWTQVCGKLLGLGAVLQSAGQSLQDIREEAFLALLAGCRDDRSSVNAAAANALVMMLSIPRGSSSISSSGSSVSKSTSSAVVAVPSAVAVVAEARRSELRSAGQAAIHAFASALSSMAQSGTSSEIKGKALLAIKQASKFYYGAAAQHYKEFFPALVAGLKDIDLRVKYFAERALKHLCEGMTAAECAAGVQPGQSVGLLQYLQTATSGGTTSGIEKDSAQVVRDYMRRILPTLPSDSDNEGYD